MKNKDNKQLPLFELDASELKRQETRSKSKPEADSPYSKHIVYVDESGDHNLQSIDEQYPVFVLAFCVFTSDTIAKRLFQHLRSSSLITLGTIR
jgi:hypothetical protein